MKKINYDETFGSFIIKYLDDNELLEGTINMNDKSINNKDLIKAIICNEENTAFSYKSVRNGITYYEEIFIVEKNITIVYDEIREEKNLKNIFNYVGDNSEFINIKDVKNLCFDKIYYQFYYKSEERNIVGMPSNRVFNGLKKFSKQNDFNIINYFHDYEFMINTFFKNFLKKFNLISYNIIACVPSHCKSQINDNALALLIQDVANSSSYIDGSQLLLRNREITPQKKLQFADRCQETHLNSVIVNGDVRGKKIILIEDITTSGSTLKACKKLLLDAGADSVICFAFAKTS